MVHLHRYRLLSELMRAYEACTLFRRVCAVAVDFDLPQILN